MPFIIITTPRFERDLRHYRRKYRKVERDVDAIVTELAQGNLIGDEIQDLKLEEEESVFKVRAANTSAGVGKRGGFRLIYYVIKNDHEIYLLTLYSKSDEEDISLDEIVRLISIYCTNTEQ